MTVEHRLDLIEARLDRLEAERFNSTVRGWTQAGRVLGVTRLTVFRWFQTDRNFPKPDRFRARGRGVSPEWRLEALTRYKNN